jgi:hypothetical protein
VPAIFLTRFNRLHSAMKETPFPFLPTVQEVFYQNCLFTGQLLMPLMICKSTASGRPHAMRLTQLIHGQAAVAQAGQLSSLCDGFLGAAPPLEGFFKAHPAVCPALPGDAPSLKS